MTVTTTARTLFAALLLGLFVPLASGDESAGEARVRRQLDAPKSGKTILLFAHFGADLTGQKLTERGTVSRNGRKHPGHYYLEYTLDWKAAGDTGSTTLTLFFNDKSVLQGTKVDRTTAELNQPYFLANLSIAVIGEVGVRSAQRRPDRPAEAAATPASVGREREGANGVVPTREPCRHAVSRPGHRGRSGGTEIRST